MGKTPPGQDIALLVSAGKAEATPQPPKALLNEYLRATHRLLGWAQRRRDAPRSRRQDAEERAPDHLQGVIHRRPVAHLVVDERFSRIGDLGESEGQGLDAPVALTYLIAASDDFEAEFLTSVFASRLPALARVARQSNAEKRILQVLETAAPEDPLSEYDLRMAEETASLRSEFFEKYPILTSAQVLARGSFKTKTADQAVRRWRSERKILAIEHGGQDFYPAFQFGTHGEPLPIIGELLEILGLYTARSDWDNALWFVAANDWLDGNTPLGLLEVDPDLLKDAAEQAVLPHVE
jgi:hypothetical protein